MIRDHFTSRAGAWWIFAIVAASSRLNAQPVRRDTVRRDTVRLDALQHAAEEHDARAAQLGVIRQQSALRTQNIASETRPTLNVAASAQYVSDVAKLDVALPGGVRVPTPYNEQYDSYLSAREPLFDPTRKSRSGVESAAAAESEARVRVTLFQQRQQVNDAFFAIKLYDAQLLAIDNAVSDLEARRKNADTRVAAGASLPSETLLIDAELARRRQSRQELEIQRFSARQILSSLTGVALTDSTVLIVDEVDAYPNANPLSLDGRPELAQFARARDALDARRKVTASQDLPRLSLVGRAGYGRPGLNALGRSFDTYWTAGVQLEWSAFNWGRSRRELEAQELQRTLIASDESAFTASVQRVLYAQRAQLRALETTVASDAGIVQLRERVLTETRLRYDEGEVTSADYIARLAEATAAQLDRDTHRIRLSEARARFLTTLGREVR